MIISHVFVVGKEIILMLLLSGTAMPNVQETPFQKYRLSLSVLLQSRGLQIQRG
jgi:hypothetical protein